MSVCVCLLVCLYTSHTSHSLCSLLLTVCGFHLLLYLCQHCTVIDTHCWGKGKTEHRHGCMRGLVQMMLPPVSAHILEFLRVVLWPPQSAVCRYSLLLLMLLLPLLCIALSFMSCQLMSPHAGSVCMQKKSAHAVFNRLCKNWMQFEWLIHIFVKNTFSKCVKFLLELTED